MYFLDSLIFSITLNCFGFLLCPTWHNLNFFFENLHLSNFQNSNINMLNLYKIQQIIFISELFTWVLKSIKLYRLGGGGGQFTLYEWQWRQHMQKWIHFPSNSLKKSDTVRKYGSLSVWRKLSLTSVLCRSFEKFSILFLFLMHRLLIIIIFISKINHIKWWFEHTGSCNLSKKKRCTYTAYN